MNLGSKPNLSNEKAPRPEAVQSPGPKSPGAFRGRMKITPKQPSIHTASARSRRPRASTAGARRGAFSLVVRMEAFLYIERIHLAILLA